MRHLKHRHKLGVKTAHRGALLANMSASLIRHKRIQTTLSKAKALRPFIEKVITLAKKAQATDDPAKKLHYRRLALAEVRDREAVSLLFNERAEEFANRQGGYTRIYKLLARRGDAAEMALIEMIDSDDEGYTKPKKKAKKAKKLAKPAVDGETVDDLEEVAEVDEEVKPQASAEVEASAESEEVNTDKKEK
jgi:large subunit ribosomal protein L17